MISDTALDDFIRAWRKARLDTGNDALGYPQINVIHPMHNVLMGGDADTDDSDAETVQRIVQNMTAEVRTAFEAYHLGIIRGDSCRKLPHEARCLILGISHDRYKGRVRQGREEIRRGLEYIFDVFARDGLTGG